MFFTGASNETRIEADSDTPPTLPSSCSTTLHDSEPTTRNSRSASQSTRLTEDFLRLIEFTRRQSRAAATNSDNVQSDTSVSDLDGREKAMLSSGNESNSANSEGEKKPTTTDPQKGEACQ